ncbi:MFS transporter [Micromonospora sp. DT48]|uniref:MFS transporter n=1 Tax=unclassified Micromonospora TaxID=2617518 RepID=UPI0018AD2099|nr:MFS transporter [Micromonospora sp. CP22]
MTKPDRRRWAVLAFATLGQFVVAIDVTVANVALPSIQAAVGLSDSTRQWVVAAYSLAFAGALLSGGRLADTVGHRRTFVAGLASFGLASIVAGCAQEPVLLLVGRVWQGLSGAVLAPSALAIVSATFPRGRDRARAMGIYSSVAASGLALGLVVGGLLTQILTWRWAFWFVLPFVAVAAVGGATLLPREAHAVRVPRNDLVGGGLLLAGLAALALGVARSQSDGVDPTVVALLAAGVLSIVALILVERRASAPLLPPAVVAQPARAGAYLVTTCVLMGLFGLFILATFYLQDVKGYSPVATGLAFIPLVVSMALGATVLSGRFANTHPRLLILAGLGLAVTAVMIMRQLNPTSSYVTVLLPAEILLGFGLGTVLVPCTNISTYGVVPGNAAAASAIYAAVQQVSAAIGTIVLNGMAAAGAASWAAAHPDAAPFENTIAGLVDALGLTIGLLVLAAVVAVLFIRPTEPSGPAPPNRSPDSGDLAMAAHPTSRTSREEP